MTELTTIALNWKSGALRLWVVLSALWCCVAFSFGFWHYQKVSQGHQIALAPACSNGVPTCEPWERDWDKAHFPKLGADAVVTSEGLIFDPDTTGAAWRTLGGAALWAFVPPLLVLAFGATLSWAISGFRRIST